MTTTANRRRIRFTACLVPVALGMAACSSGSAAPTAGSSAGGTLHFFQKQISQTFRSPEGAVLPQPAQTPGTQIEETDLDYSGNHLQHAKQWTASDHILCVINSKGLPVCHGDVAVGASIIVAEGVASPSDTSSFPVTSGTGIYQGLTGTLVGTNLPNSNDSDVVITLRRG